MKTSDPDVFEKDLENAGEEYVRSKFNRGGYGENRLIVDDWLNRKDREREQTIKERELAISEKSANAADTSAKATRLNVILTAAAVAVSFLSLYFSLRKDAP